MIDLHCPQFSHEPPCKDQTVSSGVIVLSLPKKVLLVLYPIHDDVVQQQGMMEVSMEVCSYDQVLEIAIPKCSRPEPITNKPLLQLNIKHRVFLHLSHSSSSAKSCHYAVPSVALGSQSSSEVVVDNTIKRICHCFQ